MTITDLSKFSKCLIRKRLVVMTPEECVRQSLLQKMFDLQFPKSLISVEKKVGSRRYDIICYTKEMTPLLLVECKACVLNSQAFSQALGYNFEINAPFICLVKDKELRTYWKEKGEFRFVPFLPSFKELYAISRKL